MFDFDNNGLPDLFVATGSVYPEIERSLPGCAYRSIPLLIRNIDGRKFELLSGGAGPAMAEHHASRGAAFADLDNDWDIDAVL